MLSEEAKQVVLIVDDNPDIRRLLQYYLIDAGFRVTEAGSGEQAIEKLDQHKPDLILLDVLMPGLNGYEVCRRLKNSSRTKDIPVIFLTALSDTKNKIQGFKAGAVDYITKPSQNEEVVARVSTHLMLRKLQKDLEEQNKRLQEENLKRRRVQDALRESRERYRLLAENSTDMISRQTPEGIYRYVSPACRTLLGYEIEEMIGQKEIEFVYAQDKHVLEAVNQDDPPPVAKYTYRARHKSGDRYVWVETTRRLIRDRETGVHLEVIAVSRNVTERKEAEAQLQQAHDLLEQRVEERTADLVRLNKAYGRFVPYEFLQFLGKESIVDVQLGDQVQREMTIFCIDIRAFSSLSEKMSPQENFNFLNAYLRRMSPIIRRHHGFIDKYIGDGVMALFPEESEHALQAAISIRQELNQFNAERQAQNLDPINTGTGIHTGGLMLGTIGEQKRMESTVISDSVNLAFRLEGLTKIYGAAIVISQSVLYNLNEPTLYHFRFLDRVRVKGKKNPVSVFEILDGDPPAVMALKMETLTNFEKGLLHYHSEEFAEAKSFFEEVVAVHPGDKAAHLFLGRADYFHRHGVPPDWEGVQALSEK